MSEILHSPFSRRKFIQAAALTGAALSMPLLRGQPGPHAKKAKFIPEGKPLRLASVGCGGMGAGDINNVMAQNEKGANVELVALCDVDEVRAKGIFEKYPNVPRFKDYREMLQKMGDKFDVVTIGTPDHMHFPIAMTMMDAGKHVYVEKPMAHSLEEVQLMRLKAREMGVVAQMGNQGSANEGTRLQQEWIRAGAIGNVRRIVAWTNRPTWPQGVPAYFPAVPVPETMDWNQWIGVSDFVDYNPQYAPFKWRGYWNWGCGALGDMACHTLDAPFRALDLRGDCAVTAEMEGETPVSFPSAAKVTYQFPERNGRPALELVWYEGKWKVPVPPELGKDSEGKDRVLTPSGGSLYYGDSGILYNSSSHSNATPQLLPAEKMAEFKKNLPPKTIPRIVNGKQMGNAYRAWIDACYGKIPCVSDIAEEAADLTDLVLLGVIAMRAGNGKTIRWDSKNRRVAGMPELDKYIATQYRKF